MSKCENLRKQKTNVSALIDFHRKEPEPEITLLVQKKKVGASINNGERAVLKMF